MPEPGPGPDPGAHVSPPQTTSPDTFAHEVAVIRRRLGLATTAGIRYEDEGWDSRVYLVDDGAVVFKFPRSPGVRARYAHEVAVLRALEAEDLPVWTPTVAWEGTDLEYFGYEGLRGTAPEPAELGPSARARLGEAIGGFARVLHRLRLPGLPDVTVADEVDDVRAKWDASRPILDRHFDSTRVGRLAALFLETVPDGLRRLGADPVPCHGDLGPWNMILADDGRVGVIDFGDVMRTDRSKDLAGLDDPVALDAALAAYGHDDAVLREKIALRALPTLLMDLLFFTGKGDAARLAVCLDRIRRVAPE